LPAASGGDAGIGGVLRHLANVLARLDAIGSPAGR